MHTQSCKRASFSNLNPARARNNKLVRGSSPTFIFEADLDPKAKFTEGVKICATAEYQKALRAWVVAGTRFTTPKIATIFTKILA